MMILMWVVFVGTEAQAQICASPKLVSYCQNTKGFINPSSMEKKGFKEGFENPADAGYENRCYCELESVSDAASCTRWDQVETKESKPGTKTVIVRMMRKGFVNKLLKKKFGTEQVATAEVIPESERTGHGQGRVKSTIGKKNNICDLISDLKDGEVTLVYRRVIETF